MKKGTKRDPELWERMVNSKFAGQQPILSDEESMIAARKLYRHAMGKPWPWRWEITSGNRYTWARGRVFRVNPDKRELHVRGLRALIHDMSHFCHRMLHPEDAPHSIRQARLEARLVKFALDRKWHEGALKPEPKLVPVVEPKAKPDVVKQRYSRLVSRRDKWEREFERAKRLLAKASSEVKTYERRHGSRLKEDV